MHEFAEEYVANLKPRDERYDTRLGDDFYVATFPNGVKTWIHLYKVDDFTRRQTLGVYPEMPLPVALEALYAARRTRAVEAELADQGLDGSQTRDAESSPINLTVRKMARVRLPAPDRRFVFGALTGVAVTLLAGLGAWLIMGQKVPDPVRVTAAVADPVPPSLPMPAPLTDPVPPETEPAPPPQAEAAPEPVQAVAATVAATESVPGAGEAEAVELGESQQALMRLQRDLAGTLAWSQLTSGIRDGEPVDQLGWIVELEDRPRRVFYFVRVRGMAGREVRYVWRFKGQVLKEDSVKVGAGWHSPAYSGITLTAQRLGQWQVEVTGPDGQRLGLEQFEARLADEELLSRR